MDTGLKYNYEYLLPFLGYILYVVDSWALDL